MHPRFDIAAMNATSRMASCVSPCAALMTATIKIMTVSTRTGRRRATT